MEGKEKKGLLKIFGKIRSGIDIANLPGDAFEALKTVGKVGYGVAGLGVVSDVIKPIGNLFPYFVGAALMLVIVGIVLLITKKKGRLKVVGYATAVLIVVSIILILTPFAGILGNTSNAVTSAQVYIARITSGDDAKAKVILLKKRLQTTLKESKKRGTADSDIIERVREINTIDTRVLQGAQIIQDLTLEEIIRINGKNPDLLFRDFQARKTPMKLDAVSPQAR